MTRLVRFTERTVSASFYLQDEDDRPGDFKIPGDPILVGTMDVDLEVDTAKIQATFAGTQIELGVYLYCDPIAECFLVKPGMLVDVYVLGETRTLEVIDATGESFPNQQTAIAVQRKRGA